MSDMTSTWILVSSSPELEDLRKMSQTKNPVKDANKCPDEEKKDLAECVKGAVDDAEKAERLVAEKQGKLEKLEAAAKEKETQKERAAAYKAGLKRAEDLLRGKVLNAESKKQRDLAALTKANKAEDARVAVASEAIELATARHKSALEHQTAVKVKTDVQRNLAEQEAIATIKRAEEAYLKARAELGPDPSDPTPAVVSVSASASASASAKAKK
jgi:hypothetical protein